MNNKTKIKLFVVDLSVKQTSPAGSCILSELIGLSDTFDIHLLSTEIDVELLSFVKYYKIEAPSVPLFLRYMIFSWRVKAKMRQLLKETNGPYLIQTTQGQYENCTVAYPHFCHRAYLKKHWKKSSIKGIRRFMRKLNHLYHAAQEIKAFKKAKVIVTPSEGLARELKETYPNVSDKIKVIANPVDTVHYKKPEHFNKTEARKKNGTLTERRGHEFCGFGRFCQKGFARTYKGAGIA